jgi:putative ABC transport system permease protein
VTGSPTVRRRLRPLLGESVRVAASSQVSSTLLGLLALLTPLVVLTTAGFSIEGQAAVLRRLDEAGTRIVTVVSTTGEGVMPLEAVDRIGRLAGVSWVVGLGPVFDVRARAPAGQPTPLRTFRAVRAPISLSRLGASEPVPGTAYVSPTSARRLGLAGAYGTLDPGSLEVTGWFRVGNPLSALDAFVLVPASDPTLRLERIIVAAEDVGWVDPIVAAIPSLLGAEAAGGVTVEESEILRTARAAIRDELVGRDRSLVIAILVVATVLGAVVVFATTLGARRDFGRRRALGATRGQLVGIVVLATLWPTLIGVIAGTSFGTIYLGSRLGRLPDPAFPIAVAILATLCLAGSSMGPAVAAATRDPVRVLRIP